MSALTYIHVGSFSGSATSLRDALARRTDLEAVDLMPLSRRPRLLPGRLAAHREAASAGPRVPWTKTAAWSRALQRYVEHAGHLGANRRTLVVQSLPAFVPGPGVRYAIYTDRVGREGAAVDGPHASRFAPGWLERETAFLRGAELVFVMGPSTADVLTVEYGVSADRVRVIGAGPNSRLGEPRPRANPHRLLFVGTQWALKGGPELLTAYEVIRAERPSLELVLVGSAPRGELPSGVISYGRVPHSGMNAVFDESDVLVMPTHMEAFGLALVEGLIKGLPCIGSTVGNQPSLIGSAGLAVAPGDVANLVVALRKILDDFPAFHERALARGAELRASMSWSRVAERILADMGTAG